jgi:hypothetical protein
MMKPIPVAALAGISGSNPASGMNVFLFRIFCVFRYKSLRRFDFLSKESYRVCVSVCDLVQK